jgi:hypothetical protein
MNKQVVVNQKETYFMIPEHEALAPQRVTPQRVGTRARECINSERARQQ